MKVLFFIPTLGHGGAERVLVNLVNHMDQERFDITVQTMFDVGIYRDKLNANIRYIGGFPWYFRGNTIVYKLFSPERLYRLYIKDQYDVIVSYLEGPSARVVAGGKDGCAKRICWMHIQLESKAYAQRPFRTWYEMERCYQQFDRLICVSDFVRKTVLKMFPVQAPVDVLYNTVETEIIQVKANEELDCSPFLTAEINIISVGKLMRTKGFERLARILKRLRIDGYPVHVYILGIGEERASLERQIRELDVGKYWTFVGFEQNPYQYVKRADLYVCSSYVEGFSTAVTEALIVGTPVVSTDCGGARELLGSHNEYGIVTENNEEALYRGIKDLISDRDLLAAYRERAEQRGRLFNTEDTVHAVEHMLEEIVAN